MADAITSFGVWVRRRRRALDMTQDDLAFLVGCSKDLIVKIEGDVRRPSKQMADLLGRALQIAPPEHDLFVRAARAELAPDRLPNPTSSVPQPTLSVPTVSTATAAPVTPILPSGTVTFLFTDMEGSTRRWEEQPDAMRVALARHDAILRETIATHNGYLFKTIGDAFCAAFAVAPDALAAADVGQRALAAQDWGSIGALRVRMAVHTGTAVPQAGDYLGQPLNRVARLLNAGHLYQAPYQARTFQPRPYLCTADYQDVRRHVIFYSSRYGWRLHTDWREHLAAKRVALRVEQERAVGA